MPRPTPTLDDDAFWPLSGRAKTIYLAVETSGRRPALDFLQETAADRNRQSELRSIQRALNALAADGHIFNPEKFKPLEDGVYEVKAFQVRILLFQHEGAWVLTNGCIKKQDRLDPAVIARAKRIRAEHLARPRITPIRP